MPSTLTGCLHPSNRHCIHWSPSGVIATACHNVLTLIDAFSLQRVQTIEHHTAAINQVAWSPPDSLCTQQHGEGPRIASADISGQIIVCDPVSGEKRAQFSLPNCNVLAMSWFPWRDMSRDFLLVLHTGDQLVLWNADSGEKVWTRQLPNSSFTMMALCPFEQEQVAVASRDCLLLLSDVHLNQPPSSPPALLSVDGPIDSIVFHSAYSNQLLVVHGDSLSCVETQVSAVLYRTPVDSAPVAVLPAALRDVMYTVQSSGSVILRSATCETDERGDCRMGLATLAMGEAPRSCRAVAAALCPTTQASLAVLMANGKIVLWQLDSSTLSPPPPYRSLCLDDLLSFNARLETRPVGKLRLRQSGQLSSLSTGLSTVRMRPMEGATDGAHLAAVGTSSGRIHLVDVFTCEVVKEFTVQSSPIKCLEWGGPHLLISAGYNHALSQTSSVRNDIHITDIRTGETRRLRQECDETPISMLRVSFYHCYLALAFQKEPLEIWDLKSFRLLRKMSRTCPLISDMAWSCKHHGVKTTAEGGAPVYRENLVVLDADNRLYHIVVKGMHVRDGKEVNTQWKSGGWSIRAMAWKDDCLAMGDADGRISVWDLSRRQSRQTRAARLPVLRMAFSRLAGDHTLAVLHQRELIVWDTDALHKMQTVQLDASVAALDMDLCGVSPLFVCNDNTFRHQPPGTPVTAIPNKLLPPLLSDAVVAELSEEFAASSSTHPSMQWLIQSCSGDDQLTRASRLRRFLGEPAAWSLLTLAAHKRRGWEGGEEADHLPPCLQLHWPETTFRLREQLVASAAVRSSSDEAAVVERAVVAGGRAREQAVDRLIGSSDLRCASLQAALLVSDQSSEQAKSLIKLIATNLIASDMVREGVQLLFLVGAGGDACKYLQSQRLWTKSVQYAKMGLADPEEPLFKWTAYMQIDHRSEFVRAEVCRGEWESARSVLTAVGRTGLAEALQQ